MGTNFYWKAGFPRGVDRTNDLESVELPDGTVQHYIDKERVFSDRMSVDYHVGKRSAAGMYCWACDVTLCEGGKDGIHQGEFGFLKACPECGKEPLKEDWSVGPAGVELGYARPKTERPTDVRGCSSFTWVQDPLKTRDALCKYGSEPVLEDEYGRELTGPEFLEMLENNCPIEFTDMVGSAFS